MSVSFPQPTSFLEVRVHRLDLTPTLTALCAGFEQGKWRAQEFAEHLMEWLPEFALRWGELQGAGPHNMVRLIKQAARSVYTTDKYDRRGEPGEILLHVAIRQVFKTIPAISKYYYKGSSNDTVKGFDAVHVVVTSDDSLELWLGEVKFFDDIAAAIADVVRELEGHTTREYLRKEFAIITNKIDPSWPHAERLRRLIDPNVSLDQIFHRLCIPVLLTYKSDAVNDHSDLSEQYRQAFEKEVLL